MDPEFTRQKAERVANDHFQELVQALSKRKETSPAFDAVILSGDFTDQHVDHGFEIAGLWVRLLIQNGFARKDKILLIPGNHDVNLGKMMGNSKTCLPVPRAVAENSYREFLRRLGPPFDKPAADLSVATRLEHGNSTPGLILVGLNSCRTERKDSQGWGYVGLDQLSSIMRRIYDGKAEIVPRDDDVMIAFTHHNPLPLWDVGLPEMSKPTGERKVSFLIDAYWLLTALNTFGFAALLHGHAHLPKTACLEGYDPRPDRTKRPFIVSAQGSFSASLDDCEKHHFAVIEIQPHERMLGFSHFYAGRVTHGTKRTWEVFPKQESEKWTLGDPGWHRKNVPEALQLLEERTVTAADQWQIMESWAPLYDRPDDSQERAVSQAWRTVRERLTREVNDIARKRSRWKP